jgi:hypothetical protein
MSETVEFDTVGWIIDEWSSREITGKIRLIIPIILFLLFYIVSTLVFVFIILPANLYYMLVDERKEVIEK